MIFTVPNAHETLRTLNINETLDLLGCIVWNKDNGKSPQSHNVKTYVGRIDDSSHDITSTLDGNGLWWAGFEALEASRVPQKQIGYWKS
jgi:hypothetical protein